MKICVCSLSIGEFYKKSTVLGTLSKKKYCDLYGYDFVDDETYPETYDENKHPAWSKLNIIKKCLSLNKYDIVVWMDADTLIMNAEIKLESFIDRYLGDKLFLLSRDNGNFINTGVWFIRTTNLEYTIDMLDRVYRNEHNIDKDYEQGPFNALYNEDISLQEKSVILSVDMQKEFNTAICFYITGHFLVHFLAFRDLHILAYKMHSMYMFKFDGEDDETYTKRIDGIKAEYQICEWERK